MLEDDSLGVLNHSTIRAMSDCYRKEYFPKPFTAESE